MKAVSLLYMFFHISYAGLTVPFVQSTLAFLAEQSTYFAVISQKAQECLMFWPH